MPKNLIHVYVLKKNTVDIHRGLSIVSNSISQINEDFEMEFKGRDWRKKLVVETDIYYGLGRSQISLSSI